MNKNFMNGVGAALGVVMMVQDWYGLEGYITHLRGNWVDLPWWIGGGFALFFIWQGVNQR